MLPINDEPMVPAFRHRPYYLVYATEEPTYDLVMWCDHCFTWHIHGPQPGHRVAHCRSKQYFDGRVNGLVSPYLQTGYVLVDCGWIPRACLNKEGKLRKAPMSRNVAAIREWMDAHPDWQQSQAEVDIQPQEVAS